MLYYLIFVGVIEFADFFILIYDGLNVNDKLFLFFISGEGDFKGLIEGVLSNLYSLCIFIVIYTN